MQTQASVTHDSRMTRKYLSATGAAERLGITRGAFTSLRNLPKPDVMIGDVRGWSARTIDEWNAQRPGPGNWGSKSKTKQK